MSEVPPGVGAGVSSDPSSMVISLKLGVSYTPSKQNERNRKIKLNIFNIRDQRSLCQCLPGLIYCLVLLLSLIYNTLTGVQIINNVHTKNFKNYYLKCNLPLKDISPEKE